VLGPVVAVVLATAVPASAHAGLVLTVHGDGRGAVWLTAQWDDGHPVTEPVGALLTASTATGKRVGPVPLKQNGTALTYQGTLEAGTWTVVAETGTPAIGRCQATLTVAGPGESPQPSEVRCGGSPPAPVAAPQPTGTGPWVYVATALGVVAVAGVAWYLVGRAGRTTRGRRR
jgi:hypothetical protein